MSKTVENAEAELIGLEAADAFGNFGPGKTFEVDTTSLTPLETAEIVLSVLLGRRRPGPRVDWLGGYDTGAKLRSLLSIAES